MPQKTKKLFTGRSSSTCRISIIAKSSVLNSLSSPRSRRNYKFAVEQFITWYCSEPRLSPNRTMVLRFRRERNWNWSNFHITDHALRTRRTDWQCASTSDSVCYHQPRSNFWIARPPRESWWPSTVWVQIQALAYPFRTARSIESVYAESCDYRSPSRSDSRCCRSAGGLLECP